MHNMTSFGPKTGASICILSKSTVQVLSQTFIYFFSLILTILLHFFFILKKSIQIEQRCMHIGITCDKISTLIMSPDL